MSAIVNLTPSIEPGDELVRLKNNQGCDGANLGTCALFGRTIGERSGFPRKT